MHSHRESWWRSPRGSREPTHIRLWLVGALFATGAPGPGSPEGCSSISSFQPDLGLPSMHSCGSPGPHVPGPRLRPPAPHPSRCTATPCSVTIVRHVWPCACVYVCGGRVLYIVQTPRMGGTCFVHRINERARRTSKLPLTMHFLNSFLGRVEQ